MAELRVERSLLAIDEALVILSQITESEAPLMPSDLVGAIEMDSLDMLEFLFQIGVDAEAFLQSADVFEGWDSLTLQDVYNRIAAATSAPA